MIDANPSGSEPLQNDTEATSEQVNNASIPQMDSTTDGLRWRGDESMPDSHSPNTSSTPGESISIRVKFMENERTLSVNRTMKVGDLKRYLQQLDNQIHLAVLSNIHVSTILVKRLGTICVSGEENVIQVDPPPPLNSIGCYKSNTLNIFCTPLNFVEGGAGLGKNLGKAVFMSVYCRLAVNSIGKHVKKGRCPKTFWPGL